MILKAPKEEKGQMNKENSRLPAEGKRNWNWHQTLHH